MCRAKQFQGYPVLARQLQRYEPRARVRVCARVAAIALGGAVQRSPTVAITQQTLSWIEAENVWVNDKARRPPGNFPRLRKSATNRLASCLLGTRHLINSTVGRQISATSRIGKLAVVHTAPGGVNGVAWSVEHSYLAFSERQNIFWYDTRKTSKLNTKGLRKVDLAERGTQVDRRALDQHYTELDAGAMVMSLPLIVCL
ncbi:hypothetical protein J6590_020522 [Homalodisca vitripennis]|nr:hypothetical protein J6590_020522 [Homalodisca vitripennis]